MILINIYIKLGLNFFMSGYLHLLYYFPAILTEGRQSVFDLVDFGVEKGNTCVNVD